MNMQDVEWQEMFLERGKSCFLLSATHIIGKEALWFWSEHFRAEKDLFDVGIDASTHAYLLYQHNLSFLPVISAEQTTLSNNGEQALKLTTCIGLVELNVKYTIKCLADTRCKLSWGHSKGAEASGA